MKLVKPILILVFIIIVLINVFIGYGSITVIESIGIFAFINTILVMRKNIDLQRDVEYFRGDLVAIRLHLKIAEITEDD